MSYELPPLPWPEDALDPYISKETIEYHYGKHHKAYVTKLNELVQDSEFQNAALEDIVVRSSGEIFNNAAQIWNHNFYWQCLTPKANREPSGALAKEIKTAFKSFDAFEEKFAHAAETTFGSGWAWLIREQNGKLAIISTSNADTPLKHGQTALFTCDVWEHAYYIDYRNVRADYLKGFWNIVNWDFVARNAAQPPALRKRA